MAVRKKKGAEKDELLGKLAEKLGVSEDEVQARALRELAASVGLGAAEKPAPAASKPPPPAKPQPTAADPEPSHKRPAFSPSQPPAVRQGRGGMPQRLFLSLDGRGLPIEVIDLPTTLGSGRMNTVWINSPQIETRHLQITQSDEGFVLEDLSTEHGTFMGTERVKRRVLQNGDEFRLAGYLRMTVELR